MELIAFLIPVSKCRKWPRLHNCIPIKLDIFMIMCQITLKYLRTKPGPVCSLLSNLFHSTGVKYEGEFDDGMFHGEGELKYANGVIVKGKWKKGQVTERKIIFGDGLEYSEHNWGYCKSPDRR